jgi:hypothetical protein
MKKSRRYKKNPHTQTLLPPHFFLRARINNKRVEREREKIIMLNLSIRVVGVLLWYIFLETKKK